MDIQECSNWNVKEICGIGKVNRNRKNNRMWNKELKIKVKAKKMPFKRFVKIGNTEDKIIYKQKEKQNWKWIRQKKRNFGEFGKEVERECRA